MKTLYLIVLIIFLPTIGLTCSCNSITKKEAKELIKLADYVLIGEAIENAHYNDTLKILKDKEKYGVEVKFKVEKIVKGKLNSDYVYINQFETGNCIRAFKYGNKYVIVGTRILKFENVRPDNKEIFNFEEEIPESFQYPPPPPIAGLTINKMNCYNIENALVKYWNNMAENEVVIYTNQCAAFLVKSKYGKLLGNEYEAQLSKSGEFHL
jgi:hypothetical protein